MKHFFPTEKMLNYIRMIVRALCVIHIQDDCCNCLVLTSARQNFHKFEEERMDDTVFPRSTVHWVNDGDGCDLVRTQKN